MPKYTGDSEAIDRGVATINKTASNMINILKNCVARLDEELSNWEGPSAESIKQAKEQIMSILDSDRETYERLGTYCEDASNLTDAAEEVCASYQI